MPAQFMPKSLCILGRQPQLGLAELESLYGAGHLRPVGQAAAVLDRPAAEIDFRRLGGTVKVARILTILPTANWIDLQRYLLDNVPKHIKQLEPGKFTLGLSVYNFNTKPQVINALLLDIKQAVKKSGRPIRVTSNKAPALSSAQVLHNRLIFRGAWELLLVKDGDQTILAQTLFIQDIAAYAARDQARPKRDARVGMLPPKLAQIIINLAKPPAGAVILDPFCGTGVVLQEARLMGYSVIGSDLQPRMVEYSQHNLDWLNQQLAASSALVRIEQADALKATWGQFDAVVSETYLGRPLNNLPEATDLEKIVQDVNTILQKFLKNLAPQLKAGSPVSLALPAWQVSADHFVRLPLLDHLKRLGYNRLDFKHVARDKLIYFRPSQIVARQLVVLKKV